MGIKPDMFGVSDRRFRHKAATLSCFGSGFWAFGVFRLGFRVQGLGSMDESQPGFASRTTGVDLICIGYTRPPGVGDCFSLP